MIHHTQQPKGDWLAAFGDAFARSWRRRFTDGRTLCNPSYNELGVWWNDAAGSTHLEFWPAVMEKIRS